MAVMSTGARVKECANSLTTKRIGCRFASFCQQKVNLKYIFLNYENIIHHFSEQLTIIKQNLIELEREFEKKQLEKRKLAEQQQEQTENAGGPPVNATTQVSKILRCPREDCFGFNV
jgi:Skp family chaperone for outer membrane proteins